MLDTKRMRICSYLLPDPGGEVVRECLDEIEKLRKAPPEIATHPGAVTMQNLLNERTMKNLLDDLRLTRSDETLEDISEKIRKGEPVGVLEAFDAISYQERLRRARESNSFVSRLKRWLRGDNRPKPGETK